MRPLFADEETETWRGTATSSHFYVRESQHFKGSSVLWASILKHYFLRAGSQGVSDTDSFVSPG